MKSAVLEAIDEIKAAFPGHQVEVAEDGDGGAFVRVHDLDYGDQYEPKRGPVTFHIVYTYPNADIYPHVLIGGVARTDKKPLGEGFQQKPMELGPFKGDATMVSRRSNHWDASRDTAAIKLVKVLDWIRSRT